MRKTVTLFPIRLLLKQFGLGLAGCFISVSSLFAQIGFNSPAGIKPTQDLEFYSRNGFLVQQKYQLTTANAAASINNLSCLSNAPSLTTLAGTLKDPSGDASYTPGLSYSCTQKITLPVSVSGLSVLGIVFFFDDFDTELFSDYVRLTDNSDRVQTYSGRVLPARAMVAGRTVTVAFVTNTNATVGRGFSLRWYAVLEDNTVTDPDPVAFGPAMQFSLSNGSFNAGTNNSTPGIYATAMGKSNTASAETAFAIGSNNTASNKYAIAMGFGNTANGFYATAIGSNNNTQSQNAIAIGANNYASEFGSTAIGSTNTVTAVQGIALGSGNTANGDQSIAIGSGNNVIGTNAMALGYQNSANGTYATALGSQNSAEGDNSTAFGFINTASGVASTALGYKNGANGDYSTALGNLVSTAGFLGAFIIGDKSTNNTVMLSTAANQYSARFAGGYRLLTNQAATIGAALPAGANAWTTISDSTRKERFRPIDGPALLRHIGAIRLGTWNYKGQREQRHYGPMAQEFFARFGHDSLGTIGCDTLINSHDFTAITFSGVQVLVKENEALKAQLAQLVTENQQRKRENEQLQTTNRHTESRLDALEALLPNRKRVVSSAQK